MRVRPHIEQLPHLLKVWSRCTRVARIAFGRESGEEMLDCKRRPDVAVTWLLVHTSDSKHHALPEHA